MSKLIGGSKINGSLTANSSIIAAAGAGAGFQNMVVLNTGASSTYTLPSVIQYAGAKFKVTLVGSGGNGGASTTTSGSCGSGGGSGAVLIVILTVVSGLYSLTNITVAAAGAGAGFGTFFDYNSITYTAGAGSSGTTYASCGVEGGVGGTFSGITMSNGLVNGLGINGSTGKGGNLCIAASQSFNNGGNTPLGWGQGGVLTGIAAGGVGVAGTGYGSGGSGGCSGSGTTAYAGGAGAPGIMIIEY